MSEFIDLCCCLCECCCDQNNGRNGCCACCIAASMLYEKNVSKYADRRLRFLQLCILLIMSLICLTLNSVILGIQTSSSSPIQIIFNDWKIPVALNLLIQKNCPEDYENLGYYEVPETVTGCVCLEDNYLTDKKVVSGSCGDGDSLAGCYTILPKDPITLNYWSQINQMNETVTTQMCVQRANMSFYELLDIGITNKEECEDAGMKYCQQNITDYSVCVGKDEQCPIRDIKLSTTLIQDSQFQGQTYELIYFSDFYVYISRTVSNSSITKGQIVKGEGVCVVRDQISRNPLIEKDYPLNDVQFSDCEVDLRFQLLSQTTEYNLMNANNVMNQLSSDRPFYEVRNDIYYKYLIMNQISYKESCRKTNFSLLKELQQNYDQYTTLNTINLVFSITFFVVILILWYNELGRCFYGTCSPIFLQIIQYLFQYLYTATVIATYIIVLQLIEEILDKMIGDCFDNYTQNSLNVIIQNIQGTTVSLLYTTVILTLIVDFFDFFIFIFYNYGHYKEYKAVRISRTLQLGQSLQNGNQYNNQNDQQFQEYVNEFDKTQQLQQQQAQQWQQQQQQQYEQQQLQGPINQNQPYYQQNVQSNMNIYQQSNPNYIGQQNNQQLPYPQVQNIQNQNQNLNYYQNPTDISNQQNNINNDRSPFGSN